MKLKYQLKLLPTFSNDLPTRKKPDAWFWPFFGPEKPVLKSTTTRKPSYRLERTFCMIDSLGPKDHHIFGDPKSKFFWCELALVAKHSYSYLSNKCALQNKRAWWNFFLISIIVHGENDPYNQVEWKIIAENCQI